MSQSQSHTDSSDGEDCFSPTRSRAAGAVNSDLVLGLLEDGKSFSVPDTYSVVEAVKDPKSFKNFGTQLWVLTILMTFFSFVGYYKGWIPKWYYVAQFVFWRLGYNVGLGYILHTQSKDRRFQKWYRWFVSSSWRRRTFELSVTLRNPAVPFFTKDFPEPFNAWMLYRYIVNLILANDLFAFFSLVLVYFEPGDYTDPWVISRYLLGVALSVFALWSKADAHRVLGDYAWYWGDFFFLLDKSLVFDGIFQMFPHPMYTVGYAFMYGASIAIGSYTAFYVSVWCHAMQLLFLVLVEDPHIQKTYGTLTKETDEARDAKMEEYFEKRELIVFLNLDPLRYGDVVAVLLLFYSFVILFAVESVSFHIFHYIFWRFVKTVYLGYILREQSMHQRWSSRFGSPVEAFSNWKKTYNTTVVMTNATFLIVCWKCLNWAAVESQQWWLLMTLGALLIFIQGYVSWSVFDAIGEFGYYFGDFFIDDIPNKLIYHGVYRYLNNPETSVGFAGYYGLALLACSPKVGVLAAFSHICAKLFEKFVEIPHMESLYGQERRTRGGLTSEIVARSRAVTRTLKDRQKKLKEQYEKRIQQLWREVDVTKQRYEAVQANIAKLRGRGKGGEKDKDKDTTTKKEAKKTK